MKENVLTFEMIKLVKEIPTYNVITGNNRYLFFYDIDFFSVYIYDIETKMKKKIDSHSSIINVHRKFENIFVLAEENTAIVYEINKSTFEIIEKTRTIGHTQQIQLVEFSKNNDKIFATYSNDRTLKVWNLDMAFCMCNILLTNPLKNFHIYNSFIFYFNVKDFCVTKINYENLQRINYEEIKSANFVILNEKDVISIENNMLIKYLNGKKEKYLQIKNSVKNAFYDENSDLLYLIFYSKINAIEIKNMTVIFEKTLFSSKIIYINNFLDNKDIFPNFILFKENIEFHYLGYQFKSGKGRVNNFPKDFWDKTIPKISGIENLKWDANSKEKVSFKKYLNDPVLIKEMNSNYSKTLVDKKKEVEVELKFNENKSFDYFQLLKMLIKDNTNKKLVGKYLKLLNENKETINFEGKESFKDEYEGFKHLFTPNELKSLNLKVKEQPEKELSEKEEFYVIINKIMTINEFNYSFYKNNIKEVVEKIQLFNQPIEMSNPELYWYRNCFIVYFALDIIMNYEEKYCNNIRIQLMQESILEILNRNILEDDSIINDILLLNALMIIIAIPQPFHLLEFNLNLIETKSQKYKFEEEIKNNNLSKVKNDTYLIEINDEIKSLNEASSLCIENFKLNIKENMALESIELKNYDNMVNEFNKIISFENMRVFLSRIFCSQVFQDAFKILYPEQLKYPFKDENDSLKFLKKYLHFIPLKNLLKL